jgi:hypothetical protein
VPGLCCVPLGRAGGVLATACPGWLGLRHWAVLVACPTTYLPPALDLRSPHPGARRLPPTALLSQGGNGFEAIDHAVCKPVALTASTPYTGVDTNSCPSATPRKLAGISYYTFVPPTLNGIQRAIGHNGARARARAPRRLAAARPRRPGGREPAGRWERPRPPRRAAPHRRPAPPSPARTPGPAVVAVGISAGNAFMHYRAGVIGCKVNSRGALNHEVAAVAFNAQEPVGARKTAAVLTVKNRRGARARARAMGSGAGRGQAGRRRRGRPGCRLQRVRARGLGGMHWGPGKLTRARADPVLRRPLFAPPPHPARPQLGLGLGPIGVLQDAG